MTQAQKTVRDQQALIEAQQQIIDGLRESSYRLVEENHLLKVDNALFRDKLILTSKEIDRVKEECNKKIKDTWINRLSHVIGLMDKHFD